MVRILLFGKNGQVGWELHRAMLPLGEIVALDYPEVDFAQPESLRQVVRDCRPDLIVNAAAYTAVDKAEEEVELAMAVNAQAPGVLAEEAARLRAGIIHYSTDYVFDGSKGESYTEDDQPNPINVYGRSKLEGERAVQSVGGAYLIFRTSWVYSLRRECFVTKVLRWAREKETLRIVDDQIGSPTWCRMLAECTAAVIARCDERPDDWIQDRAGIYHLAGKGACSRWEWAMAIVDYESRGEDEAPLSVLAAQSADFPSKAKRPTQSALACDRFERVLGLRIAGWDRCLELAMESVYWHRRMPDG